MDKVNWAALIAFFLGALVFHLVFYKWYVKKAKDDILDELSAMLIKSNSRITIESDDKITYIIREQGDDDAN